MAETTAERTTTLSSIPSSTFAFALCPFLGPSDLLALRLTNKRCHALLHDEQDSEQLWEMILRRDFGMKSDFRTTLTIKDVQDAPTSNSTMSVFGVHPDSDDLIYAAWTAFESWKYWMRISARFEGRTFDAKSRMPAISAPHFLRAARLWKSIFHWCDDASRSNRFGSEVKKSFRPGVTRDEWPREQARNKSLWAIQAVYAFVGGQLDAMAIEDAFCGFLGGCHAYNYFSCTHLTLPWRPSVFDVTKLIGIAKCRLSNIRGIEKTIGISLDDGMVYMRTEAGSQAMVNLPAQQGAATNNADNANNGTELASTDPPDTALLWLEEYARRLVTGYYRADPVDIDIGPNAPHTLNLYPQLTAQLQAAGAAADGAVPIVSRAVSRGIEVIASSVYVPQCQPSFGFIYSIRIRLLTPDDGDEYMTPAERGFETCQLQSRHWHIFNEDTGEGDRVNGEGVVGHFPRLFEGGYLSYHAGRYGTMESGPFEYQSCTGAMDGYFEGHMMFVPGDLSNMTGAAFQVQLGRFALSTKPQFLY